MSSPRCKHQRAFLRAMRTAVPLALLVLCNVAAGASGNGIEIKPFGLLDVDTLLIVSYDLDRRNNESASGSSSFGEGVSWVERFSLMTKSYVYHPAFLNIDFMVGPSLLQQQFDTESGVEKRKDTLVDFLARFNFLDIKNYPISLYVERSHPSIKTGVSLSFPTETDRYGLDWQIAMPERRASIGLNVSHDDSQGQGFGSVLDEDVDRGSVTLAKSYGKAGDIKLEQTVFNRISASGSSGLPIQTSEIRQRNSRIVARNRFGENDRLSIVQTYDRIRQTTESASQSEFRNQTYSLSTRYDQTESILLSSNYRFYDSERLDSSSKNQNVDVSLGHTLNENLRYNTSANYTSLDQTGFAKNEFGILGGASYSRPTSFGNISLSATVRQQRSDQESEAATVDIFEEPVVLQGTNPVDLLNEFVVESSVIVRNAAQTQVFVEGLDYRLLTIGSVTSIQRLINGNILDGQTVLVDYEYQTSGTAELETFGMGLNASAQFLKYVNARVNFNDSDSRVLGGQLTRPTNDRRVIDAAISADFPLGGGWKIGGEVRHIDLDEEISPSVSDRFTLRASTSLFGSFQLSLSGSLDQVDYEASRENVDQVAFGIGVSGRIFRSATLRYDANYLKDDGGSSARERFQQRLDFQWRFRQTRFFLRAMHTEDSLGDSDRNDTRVTAEIARYF